MAGSQYVEFALACGSAVGANGDGRAFREIVAICAGAYYAASGSGRDSASTGDIGEFVARVCGVARLGGVGEEVGRVVSAAGFCGNECSCQDGRRGSVSAESSGCDVVGVGVGATVDAEKPVRGKHYFKNKVKREKQRAMNESWRKSTAASEFVSAFDGCEKKVKDELRDSRAKMLVEKNKLAAVKAVAEAKKLDARVQARVDELQLEEYRHKLDAERKKRIEVELSKLPAGYAETMVSEGISSPIPSLSDGSVSPNSSVSVAQVSRMEDCIQKLTARVAELTAESVERDVKQKAAAMMKASSRVQVRYNDGYSVWD